MVVDNKNKQIIYELDKNARISLTKLAKKVNLSKQSLLYRIKNLEVSKIILKYTAIIDTHKLGLMTYRVYVRYGNVADKKEEKIIEYFKSLPEVIWGATLSGKWNLEIVFGLKDFIKLNYILKEFREKFGKLITKIEVSMSPVNYHFQRDYLINQKRTESFSKYYGFESSNTSLDNLDKKILKELTENCRQNTNEIGEKVGVTYHTIKSRIKKLENSEIIKGYRVLIDFKIFNREYYKILVSLGKINKEEEKNIYTFLSKKDFVVYLVEVLGNWNLEIECESEGSNQIDDLIKELRNNFSENISEYEIIKVTKEIGLNYFPQK